MDKAKIKDIPKNAVVLTRMEAINHTFRLVRDHRPQIDVFLTKYGTAINGAFAALGGVWSLRYFRRAFGLRHEVTMSSTATCSVIPAFSTFTYQYLLILPPVLLRDPFCSVCLELRSGALQLVAGAFVPILMGFVTASMTAKNIGLNVPKITEPIQLFKLGWQIANHPSGRNKFVSFSVISFFGAMCIVNAQKIEMYNFKRRLDARREFSDD